MIKAFNKQIGISAMSVATVNTPTGEVEVPINYMAATIKDGKPSINQAVQNESIYFEHLEEAKKDYDAFYDKVIEILKAEKN